MSHIGLGIKFLLLQVYGKLFCDFPIQVEWGWTSRKSRPPGGRNGLEAKSGWHFGVGCGLGQEVGAVERQGIKVSQKYQRKL